MEKNRILWKETLFLRLFGFFKVPMIGFLKPCVLQLNEEIIEIKIPLKRRSKNHLHSMYFGALATAADMAGGILAFKIMRDKKVRVNFVFKDIKGDFLKRAEGDTHFICRDGNVIVNMMDEAINSGERHEGTVRVEAIVPSRPEHNPVAKFDLTISVKRKS